MRTTMTVKRFYGTKEECEAWEEKELLVDIERLGDTIEIRNAESSEPVEMKVKFIELQ